MTIFQWVYLEKIIAWVFKITVSLQFKLVLCRQLKMSVKLLHAVKNVLVIVLNSAEIRQKNNIFSQPNTVGISEPRYGPQLKSFALQADLINRA